MRYKELHMDRTKIPCQKTPYRDIIRSWKEEETIYSKEQRKARMPLMIIGHGETQNEDKKTYQELQSSNARRAGYRT